MPFPSPDTRHPIVLPDGATHPGVVFLDAAIDHSCIQVGAYTYASSFAPPLDWAATLAPYLYEWSPETLSIGRFCQIAHGVVFVTASANHRHDGFSSFPFAIFDGEDMAARPSFPAAGPDTCIGHDVWLGHNALVLPGARIGDGAIVGAGAVVGGHVPPYSVVAGNPARVIRRRFSDPIIDRLVCTAWWHWPIETILDHEAEICGGDMDALEQVAKTL